jgi:hypothetical protein
MGMATQLSPGIVVREYDISTIVPQVSTGAAAYVGSFEWGPVDKIKTITTEEELVNIFGRPGDDTFQHFFSAKNFLDYSQNLRLVRVVEDSARNATSDGTGILIKNEAEWNDDYSTGLADVEEFAARCPGAKGNSIKVEMADAKAFSCVTGINLLTQGTGYNVADNGDAITISAPPRGSFVATATASISGGAVNNTIITRAGTGYTTADDHGAAVTFSASPGVTAVGTLNVVANVVTGITITTPGSGYVTAPTVTIPVPKGAQATATMVVVADVLTSITVTNKGYGYRVPPTVTIPAPVGGGVTATAEALQWDYKNLFLTNPGTSDSIAAVGGSNDEMHIVVVDADGAISGEAGTVLEKYPFVSKATDAKYDDGTSAYYVNAIRDSSTYIFWMDHKASDWGVSGVGVAFTELAAPYTSTLSGGVDGNEVSNDELIPGWDLFKNKENVEIGMLIGGPADDVLKQYLIQNIAEIRKDCVACLSPNMADVVNNYSNEVEDVLITRDKLTSSSYGFMDCNWKYQFDRYNDTFRWVPCNGDTAGLMAYTEENRDAWWSPAGFNRGHMKNVVKLAWNPNKTQRDELYQNGVNPVLVIAGEGTVLFGDKTMLTKPSGFDRINVRRLFIVLEKAIEKASRYALFEFNDSFTRLRFRQIVEPFLRDVQGRRGIIDFKVVCDETNNTGYVIDSNGFVGDIYIKPARSINYITLNFVLTPTGVSFEEVQGTFGDF